MKRAARAAENIPLSGFQECLSIVTYFGATAAGELTGIGKRAPGQWLPARLTRLRLRVIPGFRGNHLFMQHHQSHLVIGVMTRVVSRCVVVARC